MKALVLAGGAGTRLRPITHTSAKQLVPLANKPILFYGLESIAAAGVREVGIVVGDTAAAIEAAVGDGSRFGLSVTYLRQEAPLGLAHAVLIARDYLGDEPFVMYLGDNLLVGGINAFVDEFVRERPAAQVLLTKVEHPENFGVAELGPDGRLVRLVEKPKEPKSDLALIGVYLFDASVHAAVAAISPSWRGELEITDAIQYLLDTGHVVRPHVLEGPWIDTGKLQDLLEANRIVLEAVEHSVHGSVDAESRLVGRVVVEEGAEIVRSVVRGPVALGAGCRIVDSYIGPYSSIGPNCVVIDSEIEHSVILEGSRVEGVRRIEDSLIGRDALVCRSDSQPRAYRFMLSDHSEARVV
ncbi:MAG: glucose-1-phosphate thymidylyltransferase [Acidimicrobiia bacterium]